MKIEWTPWTYGSGFNGRVGRVGTANVAYDLMRPKDAEPSPTPWGAAVFSLQHTTGFACSDEAKRWCERVAEKLLREALGLAADKRCGGIDDRPAPADRHQLYPPSIDRRSVEDLDE